MAQIHEARNDLKIKYEQVRYTSRFDRFLHSPAGNRLCLILMAVCGGLFVFFVLNPGIPLGLRETVPLAVAELLVPVIMALHARIVQSLGGLVIFLIVAYFLLRDYFSDFISFLFQLFALPFLLIILYTFFQSIVHISLYALPLLTVLCALAVICETKYLTRIVTADSQEGQIRKAGLLGEKRGLALLRRLGSDCHVFTNLRICYQGRESETDLVVLSPSGITIVEVKNYGGTVTGDLSNEKLSHNGKAEYNPVDQVETHARRMAGFLRDQGIRMPVQRCVLFVNPRVRLDLRDYRNRARECPVVTARDRRYLFDYLDGRTGCRKSEYLRAVEALDRIARDSFRQTES